MTPSVEPPYLSIIIPCRNEADWIVQCLESIIHNDYPKDRLEVLIIDGMSDDGTRVIVKDFSARHPCVRLLDNPKKITPAALNVGIAAARGEIVMRMDSHAAYPDDYISTLVRRLKASGADNVGCACLTCAANSTALARAIALGISHRFGIGNSYFRLGTIEPRWVDTVPFGCYRREIFDRIGLFDEELVRNQDDEFNLRLIRSGGRILLIPEVRFRYYARDSLGKLWRMYYQYGYFKPLVARKLSGVMTLRQLVPAVFVLSLATTSLGALWSSAAAWLLAAIVLLYLLAVSLAALFAVKKQKIRCALALYLVFPTLHFSYGLGYIKGVLDFLLLRRNLTQRLEATTLTR